MKPARSPQTTGLLPSRLSRRLDVGEHVGLGDDGPDHLDEVLHGRGVEEVHADDPAGVAVGGGDLGDRERGGVGREDRVGAGRRRPELAEDGLLDLDRLDDRLDHEVGVGEVLHAGGEGDPADQLGLLGLGQLAARDGPAGRVLEVLTTALERLVGDLDPGDVEAVAGEDLGDPGAHRAEPDHADPGELALRGLRCSSWAGSSHAGTASRAGPEGVERVTLGPCRFARRETRRGPLPGGLRRAAHRPPADGHPGADDQGRRVGARALRRRLLQAAELDVAALQGPRGRQRRGPGRVGRHRQGRRHPAHPHRGRPARLQPRARRRPRPAEGRRREAPPGAARRAPGHPGRRA